MGLYTAFLSISFNLNGFMRNLAKNDVFWGESRDLI